MWGRIVTKNVGLGHEEALVPGLPVSKRGNCSSAMFFASKRAKAKKGRDFCHFQPPLAVFFAFPRFETG
jgi:hypothetical protein